MASSYTSSQPAGYTNHIKNIAIVGASGTIGSHIVSALLSKQQFNITALTRTSSKSTLDPAIKVAYIDYTDPSTITTALKGIDALIITLSVIASRDTQPTLIRAAAAAGVPWIMPNEYGTFNSEAAQLETIGPSKSQDRSLLNSLDVSWVGLTCGFWYEYSLAGGFYGIDIKNRHVTFFDDGTQKINTSTWEQVGKGVAALMALPILPLDENDKSVTLSSYRNRMCYIASFAVAQRDMFEAVKRVTGTEDGEWEIESVDAKQRFKENKEIMKTGNRQAFGRALYTRYFIDGEGLFEKTHGLDNEGLGLVEGDLDAATEKAVRMAGSK